MNASVVALLDAQSLWYLTRATGVVALVLLTASVVLGVTEAVRWASERWPRFVTAGIHKNVSLTATTFIAVHIATAIVDGFAPIGWLDVIVPFHSAYRPIWLGLGTVAFDLLIAIALTSLFRRRIGHRAWRIVHWSAYACWPIAFLHALGTGTDTNNSAFFDLDLVCLAAVVFAVWWRVAAGWPRHERQRILAGAASVIAPIGLVLFALAGPLQPGWARRAGTPTSLLGTSAAGASTDGTSAATGSQPAPSSGPVTAPPSSSSSLSAPFDASLAGTLTVSGPDSHGNETITIKTSLTDGADGSLLIVLRGTALDDGGVSLTSSTVTLTGADHTDSYSGSVTELRGSTVAADVQSAAGSKLSLEMRLSIDDAQVSGTVHGEPQ